MADKKYIKNGVVNNGEVLVTEEGTIFNPTPEMYYERGWLDFEEPVLENQQSLEQIRAQILAELVSFENGTAVKGAYIDDELTWIPKEDRCAMKDALEALKEEGTTTIEWKGKKIRVDSALIALRILNAHAARVTIQTVKHKQAIEKLTTEQDLLRYDYTEGYPDIPEITL